MKVLAFLCLILGIACLSLAASPSGYSHVISHLDKFQTPSGGFSQTEGGQPSLEATSHALFLSSLFGLRKKINPKEAAKYVASLENSDKGFGKSTNMATDVESTRHAVFSYHYLGSSVPNAAEIAKSLSRLRDPETGLFFSRTGEKGDLKSTALALQTLEILRENQRTWVQEGFDKIKAYLTKHAKVEVDRSYFAFPEEKSLGALSANYYGIVLGSYVGYDFASPRKWAAGIQSLQSKEGGFYTGFDKKSVSVEATAHAISSLRTLQQLQKDSHDVFVDAINTESLLQYVATVPSDLRAAAQAHLAVALTNSFSKNFDTSITYEVLRSTAPVGKQIVQGAQIKPVVTVKTHEGVPHAGLDIDVTVSYASQSNAVSAKLKWMDKEYYSPDDFFDTSNQLGEMKFVYTIRTYVVGIGELSFEKTDIKLIGYGVVVAPTAVLEVTGKEFHAGETVAIGTDFSFSLTLQNQTHDSLTSGNFDVIFTVQDSSLVAIHTDRINCKGNTKPLKFAYSLKTSNIPSGELSFHFEVASTGGKIHTSKVVTYQLNIPMIATNIQFDGFARGASPLYKIGQTVRVVVEPASFPDLRNVHAYSGVDVNKNPVADKRHLVMDLSSTTGTRLRSVQGKARTESGHSKYVFEVPVAPTLDSIGVNLVSFRYITAAGTPVTLANYDSALGELYEDASQLNFTVISELHMVDIKEQPKSAEYFYGHDINFRFRVKDALSGQYVDKGQEQANVYLLLKHKDENRGKTFTSAHEAAQQVTDEHGHKEYVIHWAINPNAVQGAGFLTLSAQGADGHHIDLFSTAKTPVHFDVTIGGQITANSKTFSSSEANARETAFVVEFDLTCQNKSLKDAQLRVSVFRGDSATPIYSGLPVATSDAGHYSFALGAPHEELPSGRYKLKFYREVDRKRALETRDLLEKKRLREELLKQTGEGTDATPVEDSAAKADVESSLTPLFELAIYHVAPPTGKSPIRPEIIFALILGGVFIAISYQKKHYLPLK